MQRALVADISSPAFWSKPIDVSKFGLLMPALRRHMAPPATVIVREDLVGYAMDITHHVQLPDPCGQWLHVQHPALLHHPVAMLVLDWLKNIIGGLDEMKKDQREKAGMLLQLPRCLSCSAARWYRRTLPDERPVCHRR